MSVTQKLLVGWKKFHLGPPRKCLKEKAPLKKTKNKKPSLSLGEPFVITLIKQHNHIASQPVEPVGNSTGPEVEWGPMLDVRHCPVVSCYAQWCLTKLLPKLVKRRKNCCWPLIGLVTVGPAENNSDESLDRSARIRTWSLSHTVVWQGLVLMSAVPSEKQTELICLWHHSIRHISIFLL